jgi:transposase
MQMITTIGLDIAKSVFQVHGVDAAGQVVVRRQLKRPVRSGVLPEAGALPRSSAKFVGRRTGGQYSTTTQLDHCRADNPW